MIEVKHYQLKNILFKIRSYLKDIINDLNKSDIWKIQLTITINFLSSKDDDKEHVMHSKGDNIEFMIYDNAGEVLKEHFESLLNKYQIGLETSISGSDFVFVCIHLLYYKCHKINSNQGGSYIDSPNWIENKKATMNLINKKDNKCFQYAVKISLNHEKF